MMALAWRTIAPPRTPTPLAHPGSPSGMLWREGIYTTYRTDCLDERGVWACVKKNCFLGYDGIWLWGSASKPWCGVTGMTSLAKAMISMATRIAGVKHGRHQGHDQGHTRALAGMHGVNRVNAPMREGLSRRSCAGADDSPRMSRMSHV